MAHESNFGALSCDTGNDTMYRLPGTRVGGGGVLTAVASPVRNGVVKDGACLLTSSPCRYVSTSSSAVVVCRGCLYPGYSQQDNDNISSSSIEIYDGTAIIRT